MADKSQQITLDKSVPEIGEAFADCKPGDKYTVVSDDENSVVLEKDYSEDMSDKPKEGDENYQPPQSNDNREEPMSDNPAVAVLIAKKRKQ